jgi:hypothetical protein
MIHRFGLRRRKYHDTAESVVAIKHSDGRRETELSSDVVAYRNGLVALEQPCEIALPGRMLVCQQVSTTSKRTYSVGMRAFEIMCRRPARNHLPWTIERVIETSKGRRHVAIPGMYGIAAPTEDVALACACGCIDRWSIM